MIKIRCVVERITYQNPENGYSVLKCRVKDYSDLVTVVGNLLDANVGSVLLAEGNWKVDAKYGRQFVAENWEETLPATVYGMEKYLGSGLIKGVGPKFAKRIVQKYGVDTFTVIEDNVELLIEVEGIGKKRVQMIAQSWERQKEVKNIMLFLQEHQVSSSFAAKIYKQYGNGSIAVMKENPYKLADDIWGIGFKTADQIAEKLGFGKESYVRLRSGLMYTLSELSNEGHVYAERQQLIDKASALLEASPETIIMTMDEMLKQGDLIREQNITKTDDGGNPVTAIYLPPFYYAEVGAGNVLRDMIDCGSFPVIRLTRIFRQAQTSRIIMNAHRINEGKMPDLSNGKNTDFFFMDNEEAETTVSQIVELVRTKLPKYYHVEPAQIQVLTPMQRGMVGATNLNLALQEALNPPEHEVFIRGRGAVTMAKDCLRRSGFAFRVEDKVMQIKNNYDKEVFNGDIGVIASVNVEDRTLKVKFDDHMAEYDGTELDELVHAYATTIHKAQGSEYPIVVMPILMNHYVMLQRNLIYTGITRAKKILVMVGTRKALSYAVRNVTVTRRNTLLKERLGD